MLNIRVHLHYNVHDSVYNALYNKPLFNYKNYFHSGYKPPGCLYPIQRIRQGPLLSLKCCVFQQALGCCYPYKFDLKILKNTKIPKNVNEIQQKRKYIDRVQYFSYFTKKPLKSYVANIVIFVALRHKIPK